MDGNIIDLQGYVADRASHFAVWGGEGTRARFALPLWRAVALAKVRRVALLKRPKSQAEALTGPTLVRDERTDALARNIQIEATVPIFVLDLGADEARREYDGSVIPAGIEPPLVLENPDQLVIALGARGSFDWFLILDTPGEKVAELDTQAREQLLFFAGECAGLLEHQGIADENTDPAEE
jgi:hypothetical protein